jgi:hypothetical protein
VYVPAYQASALQGLVAETADAGVKIRTTKSVAAFGSVFTIGTALATETYDATGFLVQTLATADTPLRTVPLVFTNTLGYYELTCPRGITAVEETIIVVGNGKITLMDGTITESLPAIAKICPGSCSVLFMVMGNSGQFEDENFADVVIDPFRPECDVLVCGWVNDQEESQPIFRIIALDTLQPELIYGTGLTYTLLAGLQGSAKAVTLAASCVLNMIVVGVQVENTDPDSLLWSLKSDGNPLPFAPVTAFNDPVSSYLRLPANCTGVSIIKVLVTSGGETYAVCTVYGNPARPAVAPQFVAVYKFTSDTSPQLCYGVDGVATWVLPCNIMASRPTDAILGPDDSVFVCGNSFGSISAPTIPFTVPCLPWLSVDVSAGQYPDTVAYPPIPFLIKFGCGGCVASLLEGLPCTSAFTWASSFVFTIFGSRGVLIGDVNGANVLLPAQPALYLCVHLHIGGCRASISNCQLVGVPVISTSCDGVVSVDSREKPTVMVVNGPVVVGDVADADPPLLPGAIRFHAGFFEGYDGASWRKFSFEPVP